MADILGHFRTVKRAVRAAKASTATATGKRRYVDLTEDLIRSMKLVAGQGVMLYDEGGPGLRIRFGRRRVSWQFMRQIRTNDKRRTIFVALGEWPNVSVQEARRLASIELGRIADRKARPGRREAIRFDAALDAYCRMLDVK